MKICILKELKYSYSGATEPKNEEESKPNLGNNKNNHFGHL